MVAIIDKDKCNACGTCVESCPVDAIKLKEKAEVDEETCIDCGTCVDECPEEAITVE